MLRFCRNVRSAHPGLFAASRRVEMNRVLDPPTLRREDDCGFAELRPSSARSRIFRSVVRRRNENSRRRTAL